MQIQDIEQVILSYIQTTTNKKYIGKLTIEALKPVGYNVKIYIHGIYEPIVIHAELEDDKFLKFIKQELSLRGFHLFDAGELNKREYVPCQPISKSCKCNEKGRIDRQN